MASLAGGSVTPEDVGSELIVLVSSVLEDEGVEDVEVLLGVTVGALLVGVDVVELVDDVVVTGLVVDVAVDEGTVDADGVLLGVVTVVGLVDVTVDGRPVVVDDDGLLDDVTVVELLDGDVLDETTVVSVEDESGWLVVPSISLPDGSLESEEPGVVDPPLQFGTADS